MPIPTPRSLTGCAVVEPPPQPQETQSVTLGHKLREGLPAFNQTSVVAQINCKAKLLFFFFKAKLLKRNLHPLRDRPTLDSSNSVSRSLLIKVEESAGLHTPPSIFCLQPSPLLSLCTSLMLMLVGDVSHHKKSRLPGHCSLSSACFLDPISFQGHSFSKSPHYQTNH